MAATRSAALVAVSLGLTVAAAPVHGQESTTRQFDGGIQIYTDSDATTVVTVVGDADWQARNDLDANAHVSVDAVSSASVDVISAATDSFTGARVELGAGADYDLGPHTVSAKLVQSLEADWQSTSLQLGWQRELARRNAAVNLGYALTRNAIGDARDDYQFSDTMWGQTWELGYSQLLDRKSRLLLAHTGQYLSGYQASPYREVAFADGNRLPERHPGQRLRAAATATLSHYLGGDTGLQLSYRFYGDSWSLYSHTLSASVLTELNPRWSLLVRGRGYHQTRAEFYQHDYDTMAGLTSWSFDKELAGMWNLGGGSALFLRLGNSWRGGLRLEGYYYRYRDFSELPDRIAAIIAVQVGSSF